MYTSKFLEVVHIVAHFNQLFCIQAGIAGTTVIMAVFWGQYN